MGRPAFQSGYALVVENWRSQFSTTINKAAGKSEYPKMGVFVMLKDEIRKRFEACKDEMFKDLGTLVAINSENSPEKPGMPFGEGPAEALRSALEIGERMGFAVDKVDNYAGAISYGSGKESVGVLAHLDIVPAGKGWDTDPFTLTEKDGRLYGRGTSDDKGPVIAALYGMKIIREMGIPLDRSIRLVVGINEELGSGCMKYYVKHREPPTLGFTPDAEYPLIYGEKGNFMTWLSFPQEETPILSAQGGDVFNAVTSECTFVLDGKQVNPDALRASIQMTDTMNCEAKVSTNEEGNTILFVKGRAAHGSTPELGINAVVNAANILCRFLGQKAGKMMTFIKDQIGRDTKGKTIGIAYSDEISGDLSLNVGILVIDKTTAKLGIDIRFPVSGSVAKTDALYKAMAEKFGLRYEIKGCSEPHYVPKDSSLVVKLLNVYREVTGQKDAQPFAIGGGTYARNIGKNFVAFGPEFPGSEPMLIHSPNEHLIISQFMDHCVICAMAMIALAEKDH